MVRQILTDLSTHNHVIVTAIARKIHGGYFDRTLHDIFKPSKFNIQDIERIINALESRLRNIECIYYTYFDTEYDQNIIVTNSLSGRKIIETEFDVGTSIVVNRIEIEDAKTYRDIIDTNFQSLILSVASLFEILVKLVENLLKKIVLYDGDRLPYSSIPLKTFIGNWDKLVDLGYRRDDDFYQCFVSHKTFLDKYLGQINSLRNRFIHGYSSCLELDVHHSQYLVARIDESRFPIGAAGFVPELILSNFASHIVSNVRDISIDVVDLFVRKLSRATKLPM